MFRTVQIFSVLLVGGHQGPGARCPKSGRGEEEEGLNCGKPRLPEAPPRPRSPRVLCCSSGSGDAAGRRAAGPPGRRTHSSGSHTAYDPGMQPAAAPRRSESEVFQNWKPRNERLSKLPEITQLISGEAAFSPRRRLSRLELVDEDKNGMDSQTIIFPTLQTFSTKENKGSLEHLPLIIPHWCRHYRSPPCSEGSAPSLLLPHQISIPLPLRCLELHATL
ncbi:uncharacterized protein [Vicugna pacos]|uniref:Uncharacterized protein n=1 Tax=Vicugna pacos TaxID=30538 RepID=A0ABM5DU31_VICPA